MRRKNKAGGITLPVFKLYDRAIMTKIVQYWYENSILTNGQNREPRSKPTHVWSTNLLQEHQKYTMMKHLLNYY